MKKIIMRAKYEVLCTVRAVKRGRRCSSEEIRPLDREIRNLKNRLRAA